ncbi:MAG: hypothetical protein VYA86_03150 [Candidatus Thermoplasmatota archaeon]|nr:hypothetical protein [Candidatus Thermoplasmatota archaeon]
MSDDDLIWVGAAPLSPEDMRRLRKDLVLQRTVLWAPTSLILSISLVFFFGLRLSAPESIFAVATSFLASLIFARISGNQRYRVIKQGLVSGMNVTPLLQQEGRGIAARFLGMPGGADILDVLMRPADGGELSKEQDEWGRVVYKTRGSDPKGPADGSGADTIDSRMPRIDAMTPRPEFEGIEDELTEGEKLMAEANTARDERAQEAWEIAESQDPDLVEAGVEKLGDLVAQGHFLEREESGDFPEAPTRAAPNTPPPSLPTSDED